MFEAMRQAAFLHKLVTRDPPSSRHRPADGVSGAGRSAWTGPSDRSSRSAPTSSSFRVIRQADADGDPLSHLVYVTRGDDVGRPS
jgi:hypothetical protein